MKILKGDSLPQIISGRVNQTRHFVAMILRGGLICLNYNFKDAPGSNYSEGYSS